MNQETPSFITQHENLQQSMTKEKPTNLPLGILALLIILALALGATIFFFFT